MSSPTPPFNNKKRPATVVATSTVTERNKEGGEEGEGRGTTKYDIDHILPFTATSAVSRSVGTMLVAAAASSASGCNTNDQASEDGGDTDYKRPAKKAKKKSSSNTNKPRKSGKKEEDDGRPKRPTRPLSAYNLFFREERQRLLDAGEPIEEVYVREVAPTADPKKEPPHDKFQFLVKVVSRRWNLLPQENRVPYEEMAKEEMESYQQRVLDYRDLEIQQAIHRPRTPPPAAATTTTTSTATTSREAAGRTTATGTAFSRSGANDGGIPQPAAPLAYPSSLNTALNNLLGGGNNAATAAVNSNSGGFSGTTIDLQRLFGAATPSSNLSTCCGVLMAGGGSSYASTGGTPSSTFPANLLSSLASAPITTILPRQQEPQQQSNNNDRVSNLLAALLGQRQEQQHDVSGPPGATADTYVLAQLLQQHQPQQQQQQQQPSQNNQVPQGKVNGSNEEDNGAAVVDIQGLLPNIQRLLKQAQEPFSTLRQPTEEGENGIPLYDDCDLLPSIRQLLRQAPPETLQPLFDGLVNNRTQGTRVLMQQQQQESSLTLWSSIQQQLLSSSFQTLLQVFSFLELICAMERRIQNLRSNSSSNRASDAAPQDENVKQEETNLLATLQYFADAGHTKGMNSDDPVNPDSLSSAIAQRLLEMSSSSRGDENTTVQQSLRKTLDSQCNGHQAPAPDASPRQLAMKIMQNHLNQMSSLTTEAGNNSAQSQQGQAQSLPQQQGIWDRGFLKSSGTGGGGSSNSGQSSAALGPVINWNTNVVGQSQPSVPAPSFVNWNTGAAGEQLQQQSQNATAGSILNWTTGPAAAQPPQQQQQAQSQIQFGSTAPAPPGLGPSLSASASGGMPGPTLNWKSNNNNGGQQSLSNQNQALPEGLALLLNSLSTPAPLPQPWQQQQQQQQQQGSSSNNNNNHVDVLSLLNELLQQQQQQGQGQQPQPLSVFRASSSSINNAPPPFTARSMPAFVIPQSSSRRSSPVLSVPQPIPPASGGPVPDMGKRSSSLSTRQQE